MRIAVAGGFGFLGPSIAKRLKDKGYEVIPFSRRRAIGIRKYSEIYGFSRTQRQMC
ncbi:MAG: NAD-dependent epimerase/dehydratase family protein [Planctomycetota bacterium]